MTGASNAPATDQKPAETDRQPSRKLPKPPKPRKVEKRQKGRKG
jgi:hypothetical protein